MRDEPWLREWLPKIEACGRRLAFDVGANDGTWTIALGPLFLRVVSLEPDPRCVSPDGVVYDTRAVWSSCESSVLYNRRRSLQSSLLPVHEVGDGGASVDVVSETHVQCVTLDELARQYGEPDFVKLDIEGAEVEALRGARLPCFSSCSWLIEVHKTRHDVAVELLRLGYEAVSLLPHPHPNAEEGHEWIFAEPAR